MIVITRLTFFKSISQQSKLMFFGSGKVGLPSLKILHQNYPQLQIVTQDSQRQKKVYNQVELYCREHNLNWSSPITSKIDKNVRKEEWTKFLNTFDQMDFGVVCSYGYMLPNRLIERFKNGLIVVHPSLLPKYRGGSPIFHAIAHGETTSGVSYIQISQKKFDQGNILHQISCPIDPKASYKQVEAQLSELAAKTLPYVIDNIDTLRPGTSQTSLMGNIPNELIEAPVISSHHLDLNRPAELVYNWSRALQIPHVKLLAKNKDIIVKLTPDFLQGEGKVGTFRVQGKRLYLKCLDKFIKVISWHEPGRSEQPPGIFIAQFIRSKKYDLQTVRVE